MRRVAALAGVTLQISSAVHHLRIRHNHYLEVIASFLTHNIFIDTIPTQPLTHLPCVKRTTVNFPSTSPILIMLALLFYPRCNPIPEIELYVPRFFVLYAFWITMARSGLLNDILILYCTIIRFGTIHSKEFKRQWPDLWVRLKPCSSSKSDSL